jgi:hypothetical protein
VKTWTIQNVGAAWPEGSKLVFARGDRELSTAEEFPVPNAASGATVDVSAVLVAPAKPGRYSAYFHLADQDRNVFGARVWADLVVEEPPIEKPATPVQQPEPAEKKVEDAKKREEGAKPAEKKVEEPEQDAGDLSPRGWVEMAEVSQAAVGEEPVMVEPQPYALHLEALANMGFVDQKLNEHLLHETDGTLKVTVDKLLQGMANMAGK